ncbi:MAG: hypothetical protein LBJ47_09815 [Tannerella sp.]|jgi:hypothetical protein|nr:hypothetical protein [Tannerella sp.]
MRGILTDDNDELTILTTRDASGKITGGFVIGDNRADVVKRLLIAYLGEIKEDPLLGGNVMALSHGRVDPFWRGKMKKQLASQGITGNIRLSGAEIEIEIENEENS